MSFLGVFQPKIGMNFFHFQCMSTYNTVHTVDITILLELWEEWILCRSRYAIFSSVRDIYMCKFSFEEKIFVIAWHLHEQTLNVTAGFLWILYSGSILTTDLNSSDVSALRPSEVEAIFAPSTMKDGIPRTGKEANQKIYNILCSNNFAGCGKMWNTMKQFSELLHCSTECK
jgi:hypothetical protein